MTPALADLAQTADAVLLEMMPLSFRICIDSLLAKGVTPDAVLQRVRRMVQQETGRGDSLTTCQVEAYLRSLAKGGVA
jgi:hypothetical protein